MPTKTQSSHLSTNRKRMLSGKMSIQIELLRTQLLRITTSNDPQLTLPSVDSVVDANHTRIYRPTRLVLSLIWPKSVQN